MLGPLESFREGFGAALADAGEAFSDLVVVDADVSNSTRTVDFARRFPERFIQVGISEQDAVSTAAGLAAAGKIPVFASFAMFLLRAWEQVRNTVARDRLNVKLVGTHSGFSDHLDGSSHQCLEDLALMRVLPNFTVVAPADVTSTRELLFQAIELRGPVYMRIGRDNAPRVYGRGAGLRLGRAEVLRDGSDVTIAACGVAVWLALAAAEELSRRGVEARVLDVHTLKPMDEGAVLKAASETSGIVTVEEHSVIGGLGGAIAEVLAERMPTRVIRIGVRDAFGRTSRDYRRLLEIYGLTPESVVRAAEAVAHAPD